MQAFVCNHVTLGVGQSFLECLCAYLVPLDAPSLRGARMTDAIRHPIGLNVRMLSESLHGLSKANARIAN